MLQKKIKGHNIKTVKGIYEIRNTHVIDFRHEKTLNIETGTPRVLWRQILKGSALKKIINVLSFLAITLFVSHYYSYEKNINYLYNSENKFNLSQWHIYKIISFDIEKQLNMENIFCHLKTRV